LIAGSILTLDLKLSWTPSSIQFEGRFFEWRRALHLTAHDQILMILEWHPKRVLCAVFNSTDTLIASTGDDGLARIWDAHPRKLTIPEIPLIVETEVPWRLDGGQLVSR
jgi:WD40 repeat protein